MEKKIFQKITLELDRLANLYNKTHDKKYKTAWYKLLEKIKFMWYLSHMDKFFYTVFGAIDNIIAWIENKFKSKKKKK